MKYLIYSIIHVVLGVIAIIMIVKSEGKDGQKMTFLQALGIIAFGPILFVMSVIGYLHNRKIN